MDLKISGSSWYRSRLHPKLSTDTALVKIITKTWSVYEVKDKQTDRQTPGIT